MATKELTEYERKRLENIRRNNEMMSAFKIQSKAYELSDSVKRRRIESHKSPPSTRGKKLKSETPVVIRRSLRTRGIPPDSRGLEGFLDDIPEKNSNPVNQDEPSAHIPETAKTKELFVGTGSDHDLLDTISSIAKKLRSEVNIEEETSMHNVAEDTDLEFGIDWKKSKLIGSMDLNSMKLRSENVAKVVTGRIMVVKFCPTNDVRIVAAGNKFGDIGIWKMGSETVENGVFSYHPHTGPISGILFQQRLSKMYSSCYDGVVRVMDAEKELFELVYTGEEPIYSLSQSPVDERYLCLAEGYGQLGVWDSRAGKFSSKWVLHEHRINSIDFNPQNPHMMLTSSTDGSACIWDLRRVNSEKPRSLKTIIHKKAVHSAYFSPTGVSIATTSFDDNVGVASGKNFEDVAMIHHNNQTGRWISSFRAVWGWDDLYLFIGNMSRGVDVISTKQRALITTLRDAHVSAIPCRFNAHPLQIGTLAGATSGGQVYVWTTD